MGNLAIDQDLWDEHVLGCPCRDNLNSLCSAKHGQMDMVRCEFQTCPFVFWLNKMKKD